MPNLDGVLQPHERDEGRDVALREVAAALDGAPSEVPANLVRFVGTYTVALFGVSQTEDDLRLCGTGTLATVSGRHYILTAAHVWEEGLRLADQVGITLNEGRDHRFLIDRTAMAPLGMLRPADAWGEFGPDVVFLSIPPERLGGIHAVKSFYNLSKPNRRPPDADGLEVGIQMGTPKALGQFMRAHADFQINGVFIRPQSVEASNGLDYWDLDIDLSTAGCPQDFRGFSGGGLWRVFVYWSEGENKIDWSAILNGLAFYQLPPHNNRIKVRCHGPMAIEASIRGFS